MAGTLDIALLRTFVMLVDDRSITRVARRLHRTQPAITLQIKRLEAAAERAIFQPDRRRLRLTPDGEALLPYARSLLLLHDEARASLVAPVAGRVTLGCPDLYAAFLLPRTLARFRTAFPGVEVTVHCALSRVLANDIAAGRIDVALATLMPDVRPANASVTIVRKEPLAWLGAEDGTVHETDPLPLGMLPENNLYRDYAIAALNRIRRPWRIACVSESIAGLQAMALADASVIVLGESVSVHGLRRLGARDGLPPLPPVELVLWRANAAVSQAARELARHIEEDLGAMA